MTIGRDASNSISFPSDPQVSRFHAELHFKGGRWFCKDLQSTNGTTIDGQLTRGTTTPIDPGAPILIGNQLFQIDYTVKVQSPPVAPPRQPAPVHQSSPPPINSATFNHPRWIGNGQTITVHGITIANPMTYVGSVKRPPVDPLSYRFMYGDDEDESWPSLVNTALPVSESGDLEPIGYYPSYERMSPVQRYRYLLWLADRNVTAPERGFLFVFFYGIERRLFEDTDSEASQAELEAIASELINLRNIHPDFGSFQHYTARLLAALFPQIPTLVTSEALYPPNTDWGDLQGVDWYLASLAAATGTLDVKQARQWPPLTRRDLRSTMVIKRCWNEICSLFESRFKTEFPSGIALTTSDTSTTIKYFPTNWTLRNSRRCSRRLKAVKDRSKIETKLTNILLDCIDDLTPYSKALGPNPSKAKRINAQILLPLEIQTNSAVIKGLITWIEENRTTEYAETTSKHFASLLGLEYGDFKRPFYQDVCACLANYDYLVEPDPRFVSSRLKPETTIVITKSPVKVTAEPTADYIALLPIIELAYSIARADDSRCVKRLIGINDFISSRFLLPESDRERMKTYLYYLSTTDGKAGKAVVEKIEESSRSEVANLLIEIALDDGSVTPSEMSELQRLFGLLGIDDKALFEAVHSGGDVVTITQEAGHPGFAVPAKPAEKPVAIIDMEALQAKLRCTERVQSLLADIFVEEEPVEVASDSLQQGQRSKLEEIIWALPHAPMPPSEFEEFSERFGMMPNVAIEEINNFSFDRCGYPLIDPVDPVTVDTWVLEQLQKENAD